MAKRKAIGADPLDAIMPAAEQDVPVEKKPRKAKETTTPRKPAKVRATFHIPEDLLEECRNTVVALSGPPERLTLAMVAETALRRELQRLKKKHNGGEDFPARDGELRGGRPIGS